MGRRPVTVSPDMVTTKKKKKRLNSCFSHTVMLLEAELGTAGSVKACADTNLIVIHTQFIFTVSSNKLEIIGFS